MRRMSIIAFCRLAVGFAAITAPVTLEVAHSGIVLVLSEANAKNGGGNGGGGGGGNGGGNGGDNGRGGESRSSGKAGESQGAAGQPQSADKVGSSLPDIGVRHKRGVTEAVVSGRYIMRDARGRTIVNRRATNLDRRRIEALLQ